MIRAVVLLCLVALSADASAHRFAPSLLKLVQLDDARVLVTWKTPIETISNTPIEPQLPAGCELQQTSPWIQVGTGREQQREYRCHDGLVNREVGVTGLDANPVTVFASLILSDGAAHQVMLDPDSPTFVVPEAPAPLAVAAQYTWLGSEHIAGGIDHLLFVLGLVLLVQGKRRLILTITAFTLGHSVTLVLATLGFISYPVAWIEFLIASIFMLAVELTRRRGQTLLWRQPWWLAGGFGLLHGMGFAGALAETGLPQANIPLALLCFNLGIELGQLLFIAMLLGLAAAMRHLAPITAAALVAAGRAQRHVVNRARHGSAALLKPLTGLWTKHPPNVARHR